MVQSYSVVCVAGLLVFGTLSSIASKVVYQTGTTIACSLLAFLRNMRAVS